MGRLSWRIGFLGMLFLLALPMALPTVLPVLAQDSGGQFWVQAFEDRNGSGTRDTGEPFLTRGVSVDLLNSDGVVMASGTLDGAPFANQGFIGFLYLEPGSYTAVISSPDLTATTAERVDVTITAGAAPVTVMYGAQRAAAVDSTANEGVSSLLNSQIARIALSGIGALIVIGVMAFLGVMVYALVLRPRYQADVKRTTASLRAVRVGQTGEMRRTGEVRQTDEVRRSEETNQS